MRKKPLIIFDDSFKYGKSAQANMKRQNLLLKGMMIYGDLDKAGEVAGIRTAVELYRTFDRMALRKGYHEALADEGINLRWVVQHIKEHAEGPSAMVSLQALRMLLTSLGLNRYDVGEEGHKNWEDTLLELSEKYDSQSKPVVDAYTVNKPEIPESARLMRAKEQEIGKELYEHDEPNKDGTDDGSEVLSGELLPDQNQRPQI